MMFCGISYPGFLWLDKIEENAIQLWIIITWCFCGISYLGFLWLDKIEENAIQLRIIIIWCFYGISYLGFLPNPSHSGSFGVDYMGERGSDVYPRVLTPVQLPDTTCSQSNYSEKSPRLWPYNDTTNEKAMLGLS
jgi:hypothetical protein